MTLGQVLNAVSEYVPAELRQVLDGAVSDRNFLAHHFWYERSHLFASSEGMARMIEELDRYVAEFESVDEQLKRLLWPHLEGLGVTPELLADEMEQLRSGALDEPLNQQRKPEKVEAVTAAYLVPLENGHSRLVFQTDDGLLWQLCDVGLGWTSYSGVGADWISARKFAPFLPSQVNPRPKIAAPWTYTLEFERASLVVQPGVNPNVVTYRLVSMLHSRHGSG